MDDYQLKLETRKYRRCQSLGTSNPFCRICGISDWWIVYHQHHVGGRRFTDDLLFICFHCHKGVHEMEHEFEPLPKGLSNERAALIHRLQGQTVVAKMQIAVMRDTIRWLRGDDDLPPLPTVNDNGPWGNEGGASGCAPPPSLEVAGADL